MNKYILELLRLQKTVILPGFGALSVVNEEKNDIMFMPYLKHDDGKLVEYISQNSNMDETEAKNSIAKFIREIELELNKGESYNIFQFGEFSKNEDGDIEFEAWKGSVKKETTPEPVVEEKVEKIVPEEKPVATEKKESEKKVEKKKEEKKPIPAAETKPKKTESKEKKSDDSKTSIFITRDGQPIDKKEELAKNSAKYEKLKQENESKPKKKKRGAGFWIAATLLLLIGAGSTIFAINYDEYKEYVPFLASNNSQEETQENSEELSEFDKMKDFIGEEENEEVPSEENESSTADSTDNQTNEETPVEEEVIEDDPEPIVEEAPEPTPVVSSSGKGNFHAIIGAFSNLENANRLCEQLKSEGFPAHIFKHGALNSVSIQSFETSQEANAKLSELRERSGGIWILKKRL